MSKFTRAFQGRGQATRDSRLPPGQYDAGETWPVLNAEVTPKLSITEDRRGCWCLTSTSGRARNGCQASACWTTTSQDFGSATAITTGAIPGSNSVTKATDAMSPTNVAPHRWQTATVVSVRRETARAKTFRLRLGEPSAHLAGQHYVIRLTAPDGYTAARSYSIASAPDGSREVEFTIERLDGGEVSMFLHDDVVPGDELEVRGPIGGWFVWRGDIPALLIGGGS